MLEYLRGLSHVKAVEEHVRYVRRFPDRPGRAKPDATVTTTLSDQPVVLEVREKSVRFDLSDAYFEHGSDVAVVGHEADGGAAAWAATVGSLAAALNKKRRQAPKDPLPYVIVVRPVVRDEAAEARGTWTARNDRLLPVGEAVRQPLDCSVEHLAAAVSHKQFRDDWVQPDGWCSAVALFDEVDANEIAAQALGAAMWTRDRPAPVGWVRAIRNPRALHPLPPGFFSGPYDVTWDDPGESPHDRSDHGLRRSASTWAERTWEGHAAHRLQPNW